mmetsp:Transcript_113523/g.212690  ORF Transcript_113523/g.212690 Transcript_113523/m.212690 type:complete len:246 (-) Transcript_113523:148-885(-)
MASSSGFKLIARSREEERAERTDTPASPRPHLVHCANLNIHLPPREQSSLPPGFCTAPGSDNNRPSGCWQCEHLPYFQWCIPLGDTTHSPDSDSIALPGAYMPRRSSPLEFERTEPIETPASPRPHLLHLANLNMHLPPRQQSSLPPGFCTAPNSDSRRPSGCWQCKHLPNFQWCTPLGDNLHSPDSDSMALLGAYLLRVIIARASPPTFKLVSCALSREAERAERTETVLSRAPGSDSKRPSGF